MISSKRFILIFASVFTLGATPLLLAQPNGAAAAGLNAGLLLPLLEVWQLVILGGFGIYAAHLRQQAMILIPLSFVLLFSISMMVMMDMQRFDKLPFFLLGGVVLFAISFALVETRQTLVAMLVSASFGFHFGMYYHQLMPSGAAPIYFMLGSVLSFALVFAAAIALGITFLRDPAVSSLNQPTQL